MKRRIIAMLMAIVMLVGNIPFQAFAAQSEPQETTPCATEGCTYGLNHEGVCSNADAPTVEPAADAAVYVTVSDHGELGMAYEEVTVSDTNQDGKLSVEEALYAAHLVYGKGYASQEGMITQLWGVETTNVSVFRNHTVLSTDVGAETVEAGDYLVASVDQDAVNDYDKYSCFDALEKTVNAGESFTLTLTDDAGNALAGMEIGLSNGNGSTTMTGLTTDVTGSVTLTLDQEGLYCVTAKGTVVESSIDVNTMEMTSIETPIIAPVCAVIVSGISVQESAVWSSRTTSGEAVSSDGSGEPSEEGNTETVSVNVSFAAQANGAFLAPPQLNLTVSSDTAESFGYTDQTEKDTQVSTIDVLVAAHVVKYGDDFTEATAQNFLTVEGNFITAMFGKNNGGNVCLLVNGLQPGPSDYKHGIEQAVVSDGDAVEFFVYQDTSTFTDKYVWLELLDGTKVDGQSVYGGKTATVVVKGRTPFSYGYDGDAGDVTVSGASLYMVDIATGGLTPLGVTSSENGTVSIMVPAAYVGQTVYLAAKGDKMAMTLSKVRVEQAPATDACNLSALEIAVGGDTVEAAKTQALAPGFDGKTTEYTTAILDYESDKNNRFVWLKVSAPEGTTVTAKCGSSNIATLVSGEWTVLQVKGGYFYSPTYSGPLTPGAYNEVIITVAKEGEDSKIYTITVPMQPDISNRSLSWKTDLVDAVYFTENDQNASLTVQAQYNNRPLENEDVITYQWYSNTSASNEGGIAIDGATSESYSPDVAESGTSYYHVVASCKDLDSITSKVIAVTVTNESTPASVSIVCDHPYTIPNTWSKALGGVSYVATVGDPLQLKAVDENGKETPVTWLNTSMGGGTLDKSTGVYTVTNTSYSYVQVASLYDRTIQSEEKVIEVKDYAINQYNKTPSVTLASDGQSFPKITGQGGIDTYTIWEYSPSADNIAELITDLSTKSSRIEFTAMRPGTIAVSFDLDLNGDGKADGNGQTDSATLTINGIAVEDTDGNLTKTYLETSAANPNPTMQLKAVSSTEEPSFAWSSADETVATVDENGVVTAKGVGSVIISASDGPYTGGIKVVVTSADTPYFEQIDFATTNAWGTGLSSASWKTATFKPTTLEYTGLTLTKAAASTLTLNAATLYNTDKYAAVATYTDENGETKSVTINSGAATELKDIPFETSTISITITDKTDETQKTVYTFEISRPRDTTKTIANNGIVFVPDGREIWSDKYNGKTEGIMYVANEDGSFAQYQGVSSSRLYYRTYAMNALEAFSLTLKSTSAYAHIRFSTDDGVTWTDLGKAGTSGVTTGKITIPQPSGSENSVVKVMVQILDDQTYAANAASGKDGFADSTPNTYTLWVEQIPELSVECDILTAMTATGDWYPSFDKSRTSYRIIGDPDEAAPALTFTVSEGAKVTIGGKEMTSNEQGKYSFNLTSAATSVTVASSDGTTEKTYSFSYAQRISDDVPDKVVDYLAVNTQYINGNGGGYGANPQQTLTGGGLLSLGNFGGYVTFYYEEGLTDNANHPYGVDFYVNGNAFKDTSTGTGLGSMEPGQVWVSEDGSEWYALAGSEHYEEDTLWDYAVTYSRTETGGTAWTDNKGNTHTSTHGRSFDWPSASVYTMNDLPTKDSFTLTGILIPCVDGTITGTDSFNSYSSGARFGYADTLVNGTANPYLDNSDYDNECAGFDLAWAVDSEGNPIDVSGKSFHYVKVVTASNIMAGTANEKSTEVADVVRATANASAVGVTAEPSGVTFASGEKTYTVAIESGKQIYEVVLPDTLAESTIRIDGTAEDDNIYINNQRLVSGTASDSFTFSLDSPKLVRIIVQNGEKEPVIYLLKVKCQETVKVESIVLNKTELTMTPDQQPVALTATVTPDNATDKTVTWTSNNLAVAMASADGVVTAIGKGTAVITAAAGDQQATCTVKVVEAAAPADITVTISKKGELVMTRKTVTVTDYNLSGTLDVDDALYAAHEAGYTGGAAVGYSSYNGEYGLSLGKLWGDDSKVFGYWLNDVSCNSLSDTVKAGDDLVAFVYQNENWTDAYARFDKEVYTVKTGAALTVAVETASWDMENNAYQFSTFDSAVISASTDKCTIEGYTLTFSAPGTYYLYAKSSDPVIIPAVAEVKVLDQAESITLDGESATMAIGDEKTLTATILPETAAGSAITWTSSDETKAAVDETGKITALATGSATITAAVDGLTDTYRVTVKERATAFTLNKTEVVLRPEKTEKLSTKVLEPSGSVVTNVVWTSSDETVATVDETGKVTAVAEGTAIITATSGELSASCTIKVGTMATIVAPLGSTVSMGTLSSYYIYTFQEPLETVEDEVTKTVTYKFEVPEKGTKFLRVQHPDGVTYWDHNFDVCSEVTITRDMLFMDDSSFRSSSILRDFSHNKLDVADVYLNANEKGYINLAPNATYQLNVVRDWMAVESSTMSNKTSLPDVHYRVIDFNGNESNVVSVTPGFHNSSVANITANYAGTAVVLVTYDAMYNTGIGFTGGTDPKRFSAIWPENTGVLVVSVGADGSSIATNMTINEGLNVDTSISKLAGDKLDAEHDVLYYTGSSGASYTFTPEDGCTVSVARAVLTADSLTYHGFQTVPANEDGSFTVTGLTAGNHIIRVEKNGLATYQVVAAKQTSYTVTDSEGSAVTEENPAEPGETLTVQFSGLFNPINKMAGIYNTNCRIYYTGESGVVHSKDPATYGVYDFASNAAQQQLTFTVPAVWTKDTYTIDGCLATGGFGDGAGCHRGLTYAAGKPANLAAASTATFLGDLPQITIPVSATTIKSATGVTISQDSLTLGAGAKALLSCTVTPEDTTDQLKWTSSNVAVAMVDQNGIVTAITPGEAVITIAAQDISATEPSAVASCKVIVTNDSNGNIEISTGTVSAYNVSNFSEIMIYGADADKESITVDPAKYIASATVGTDCGDTLLLSMKSVLGYPWNSNTAKLYYRINGVQQSKSLKEYPDTLCTTTVTPEWTETGTAEIKMEIYSTVNPKKNQVIGTYTITLTKEGMGSVAVSGITLDKTELSLQEQETAQLTTTVEPENATDKTVVWTSSDETVATVKDGLVTGVKAGTAIIKATAGEQTASCTVTVTPVLNFDIADDEIAGWVTVSFVDNGERLQSDLPGIDAQFKNPLGTIVESTKVPFKTDDTIAAVTLRLLDAMDITASYSGDAYSDFYLSSIGNFTVDETTYPSFGESDAGAASGWMVTQNDVFINKGASEFIVKDGDTIEWQYTCQLGADIGDSYSQEQVDAVEKLISDIGSPVTLESEEAIQKAREAYDKLAPVQKELVENYETLTEAEATLALLIAAEEDKAAAKKVIDLIKAIGEVTKDSKDEIEAAREAYNALNDTRKDLVSNYEELREAEETLKLLGRVDADIVKIYMTTGDSLAAKTLGFESEWIALGLARSGRTVADSYYESVVEYVKENISNDGRLHEYKSTDNSRVILALTAIGKDVTDVGGKNLISGLDDLEYISKQGINGPIWALIALDSHDYTPEGNVTRDALIKEILDAQNDDGGWSMSGSSDADMTAMAIQALAPYCKTNDDVETAVDEALTWLSDAQNADGSFSSGGVSNAESTAQVIVALTALGIDPDGDSHFIENETTAVQALAQFYVGNGGFEHIEGSGHNEMATEQGYYALAAYARFKNGQTSLYDMSDVTIETSAGNQAAADAVIALINAIGTVDLDKEDEIEAAREAYGELTPAQQKLVTNYETLTDAETDLAQLKQTAADTAAADAVKGMIDAIGTSITLDSEEKITAARNAYNGLSDLQKNLVGADYLQKLTAAEAALAALKQAAADEAAAAAVEAKISDIGTTITLGSEAKITTARNAYNGLTAAQKALVSNYTTLEKAEAALDVLKSTVSVTFSLLGCYKHGSTETSVHTLAGNNLQTWIAAKTYKVKPGATVKDLLEQALKAAGMTWSNPTGNYVESITKNGVKIAEFTNGKNSGWMYTLNGRHPSLGVAQQTLVSGDVVVFHYTDDYTKESGSTSGSGTTSGTSSSTTNYITTTAATQNAETADSVERLIEDIGEEITLDSEAKILAARAAYDKLTEAQKKLVENYDVLVAAEAALAELKGSSTEDVYIETGDYLQGLGIPGVGSVGGEWMVIGLARANRTVPSGYYDNVVAYVRENINELEQLHSAKSTDNARLILALTAIGRDVTNVDGHDLLKGLNDMAYIQKQGINGPIWALLAFDSGNYPVPEGDVSRDKLIEVILEAQLADGGWALSGENADVDMTAMAIQALAPYVESDQAVKTAALKAVSTLSEMQNDNGSFSSVDGANSESIAQVIVALAALGIDADTNARFVKNGISALDALVSFYVPGGGFRHTLDGDLDGMATEQAYYALVAYNRMLQERTFLYDMTDVIDMGGDVAVEETDEPAEAPEEPDEENDGNPMLVWVSVMALCAAAAAALVVGRKKFFKG